MPNRIILLTLISTFIIGCNMTFLNHKDYKFKLKDFVWNIKIEGQVGEIYLKESNFIFGRNADSTFIVISPESGAIIDTLTPYTIEKERVCLINEKTGEYKSGYSLHNVPVDKQKYSKVTLKCIDRQFRGDSETFYLIVNTLSNKEFTILFNRSQFDFISDVAYFKDGKFIMTYDGVAASEENKYTVNIGLFDLEKIIKDAYRAGTDSKEVFQKSEESSNGFRIIAEEPLKGIITNGTVKIGSQIWMVENLNVEKFRNGDLIPEAKTKEEWISSGENRKPAWCYYENDNEKGEKYGKLYNWYAVSDKRGLAPEGWHIPTIAELKTLGTTVHNNSNVLKEIGQVPENVAATNTSGFSALLAGYRTNNSQFNNLNYSAYFWSSTEFNDAYANFLYFISEGSNFYFYNYHKNHGFSVRCLKDI